MPNYRTPPDKIDMVAVERAIRRNTVLATIVTLTGFIAAFWVSSAFADLPTGASDRLAFAAQCWAIPGLVLLAAILMVSTTRRLSAEDIGGQAAGPPSDKLAIKAAFLQNTLEQAVVAGGFYFAFAAVANGPWLGLLPVSAFLFVIGRVLFYIGYHRGAQGRSLGMALTMMPAVLGYPLAFALVII